MHDFGVCCQIKSLPVLVFFRVIGLDTRTMLFLILSTAILSNNSDVAKSQKLYDKARYEQALLALGQTCMGDDLAACEQLRAFILIAVGRDRDGTAAFERMLQLEPTRQLPPGTSPKLQALFDHVIGQVSELSFLRLEQLNLAAKDLVAFKIKAPESTKLQSVIAHIDWDGRDYFKPLSFQEKEGSWVASATIPEIPDDVRYYLVAALPSGTPVQIGTQAEPLKLSLFEPQTTATNGETTNAATSTEQSGVEAQTVTSAEANEPTRLQLFFKRVPPWAIAAGVGGVVLAGVLTILVVSSGGEGDGSAQINLKYSE